MCCKRLTPPHLAPEFLRNRQIAMELGLDASDAQAMTERLRDGLVAKAPAVELQGEVEVDVVAGHKGRPPLAIPLALPTEP